MWYARHPIRAVGGASLLVTVGQETLCCYRCLPPEREWHFGRDRFRGLTGPQRVARCRAEFLIGILVLEQDIARFPSSSSSAGSAWSNSQKSNVGRTRPKCPVRANVLPLARRQSVAVPVQPLQVEHRLRHPLVPRLLHPQHAVHALHRAAGSHRAPEHRRHPVVRGPLRLAQAGGPTRPRGSVSIRGSEPSHSPMPAPPTPGHRMRHSARGSACASRRCIRSRNAVLRGSLRKFRTVDHSAPVRPANAAAISASARVRSLSRPSASNRSRAARARRQAASWRSTPSNVATARARRPRRPWPRPAHRGLAASSRPPGVGRLGLGPRRLGPPPGPGQHAIGPRSRCGKGPGLLQGRGARGRRGEPGRAVETPRRSPWRRRRRRTPGGEGGQSLLPGLGLAVGGVVAEDGGHARRLDADQGRSPPKKISSSASVRTSGTQAASSASRTALAFLASSATQRPIVE